MLYNYNEERALLRISENLPSGDFLVLSIPGPVPEDSVCPLFDDQT